MVARISCLALAMGILVGCYDLPQPECGFACGPSGACPTDYSCNTSVNRCELAGSAPSCAPAFVDAGMDFTPPVVIPDGRLPAPSSGGVSITTSIEATFSEPLAQETVHGGSMTLWNTSGLVSGDVSYDPLDFRAIFTPSVRLLSNENYTVSLTTMITDLGGNPLPMPDSWTFTTAPDLIGPMVILQSPMTGETGVGVGAQILVDFSEIVIGVTNTSFTLMQGTTPVSGTVMKLSPSRAIMTPTIQLAANTMYTVNLTSAIRDLDSNTLLAVSWTFTTGPDEQEPTVVNRTPLPTQAGVAVSTSVTASFSENVVNITGTSFTLTPQGGSPVAATVGYTSATRTTTLMPTIQLAVNTQYTASLTAAITDAAANPLAPVSWSFTTGADNVSPNVVTRTPAPSSTGVSIVTTVTASFNEPVLDVSTTTVTLTPMGGSPIAATVSYANATRTATLTPTTQLDANTVYTVDLSSAITDAAANPLPPDSWMFTTAP